MQALGGGWDAATLGKPDGAAAQLVRDTDTGVVAAPEDVDGIRDASGARLNSVPADEAEKAE